MRLESLLVVALVALAQPAVALAEKPAHAGKNNGRGHAAVQQNRQDDGRRTEPGRASCPPGLAKKSPACVPPGQARHGLVGRVVDRDRVHFVRKPGLYGLAQAPNGQRYAIVDGRLVRIDSQTAKVLSVIRAVDAILD